MEQYTESDRKSLLIATSAGSIITPLMSTMMNLSLVSIGEDFGVGPHSLAYVNTMFLLGSVVCMVPAAKYASIKGMKKIFILGLIMLMVSCILSMFSPGFGFLVAMRFVIGFASSMLMVTSMAMLTFVFPISSRGKILGFNVTFVYLGLSLGPTVGGIITDFAGWRCIFAFVFVLSAVALITVSRFRKEVTPIPDETMDWKGSVLWGLTIVTLMFGIINITQPWAPILAGIGFVLLAATWYYLRNAKAPVLNTKMFRNGVFSRACVAAFMNYGASYCITYFLSLYLQNIGKMSASEAGVLMLVQPFVQMLLSMKMGALSDRIADKRILPTLGMAVTGLGVGMYLLLTVNYSVGLVAAIMIVTGIGLGIFSAPNNSLIVSSVEPHLKGEASGVVSVVRQTGMMVSMAIAMSSVSVIMGSADNLTPATYGSFVDVIHLAFSICVLMCAVGIACSLIGKKATPGKG